MEVADADLYAKDINEGDWVYFDKDNQIYALQSELQNARNQIDNASQTQALVNALKPYPVPAYQVGSPYASANGCGCTLS